MNSFIAYILELNIALSALYLIYWMVFREDSNFSLKRLILVFTMVISMVLPLLNISTAAGSHGVYGTVIALDEVIVNAGSGMFASETSFQLLQAFIYSYLIITSIFLARLLIVMSILFVHAAKSEQRTVLGTLVRISRKFHASSFFNMIFIDPEKIDENNGAHIIQHEQHHVNLWHSVDRLLAELLLSLAWINPLVWLFRRSVITNHEYQADNRVVTYGTDMVSYQLSILNQYIGSASISNQFSSQIKNRIIMLNKNYRKGSFWKSLLLIPVGIILFFVISCNNEGTEFESPADKPPVEEEIFYVVEEMPTWAGGGDMVQELRNFIAQNLIYPKEAIENKVEGKIYVHFIVNSSGKVVIPEPSQLPPEKTESGEIGEVVVVSYRPLNDDLPAPDERYIQLLKEEGIRVIESVPDLVPGKQRGKAVNVVFTMPITFILQ